MGKLGVILGNSAPDCSSIILVMSTHGASLSSKPTGIMSCPPCSSRQFFFHIQNLHHLDLEIVVLLGVSIMFVQRIKCANSTEPASDAKRLGRVNPAAPLRMHDIGFAFGLE